MGVRIPPGLPSYDGLQAISARPVAFAALDWKRRKFMGRLKRKRPASPKKKGRRRPTKENKRERELKGQGVAGGVQEKVLAQKEVVAPKKEPPKAVRPAGRTIQLALWTKTAQFLREVKIELKKVTWPSRKETMASTVVVIILVMIVSVFLGLVDVGLSSLIRVVLH
jgi:preprotein translocase subunit SecE